MGLKFRPKPGESVQIGQAFIKFGNCREDGQAVEISAPVQWIIKRTFPGSESEQDNALDKRIQGLVDKYHADQM